MIPIEIWEMILEEWLPNIKDVITCTEVCKLFKQITSSTRFWEEKLKKEFAPLCISPKDPRIHYLWCYFQALSRTREYGRRLYIAGEIYDKTTDNIIHALSDLKHDLSLDLRGHFNVTPALDDFLQYLQSKIPVLKNLEENDKNVKWCRKIYELNVLYDQRIDIEGIRLSDGRISLPFFTPLNIGKMTYANATATKLNNSYLHEKPPDIIHFPEEDWNMEE